VEDTCIGTVSGASDALDAPRSRLSADPERPAELALAAGPLSNRGGTDLPFADVDLGRGGTDAPLVATDAPRGGTDALRDDGAGGRAEGALGPGGFDVP
jgi:hypothetical protein